MPQGTPTFFTIAEDGTVSADFSGHVSAAGIDLQATVAIGPNNRVAWFRSGLQAAFVGALESNLSFVRQLLLQVNGSALGRAALNLTTDLTANVSSIRAAVVNTAGGGIDRLVIDSDKKSEYLQLATARESVMDSGTVTVIYNGTSSTSIVVAHTLGVIPTMVFVQMQNGNGVPLLRMGAKSSTQFTVEILSNLDLNGTVFGPVANGTSDVLAWLAFK